MKKRKNKEHSSLSKSITKKTMSFKMQNFSVFGLHSKKKYSGITLSNKLDLDGRLLYMGPNYIPIIRNYTEIILNYIKLYKVIQPWRVRFTKIIQYYICAI